MRYAKIVFFIVAVFFFTACQEEEDEVRYVSVHNATNKTFFVYGAFVLSGNVLTTNQIDSLYPIKPFMKLPVSIYKSIENGMEYHLIVYDKNSTDRYTLGEIKERTVMRRYYKIPIYELISRKGIIVIYDDDDTSKW
jgi:hypothetical protein